MPCACAIACSSGWVMKPATVCESAPKYTVCTVMVAFSVFGYWRTGSVMTARRPSTRISRLTVAASTGRLMKRSVNFIRGPAGKSRQLSCPSSRGRRGRNPGSASQSLEQAPARGCAASGMTMLIFRSLRRGRLLLHRLRVRIERRLHAVVDVHRRVVLQLQLARSHHHFAFLESVQDRDLVAAARTHRHQPLFHVVLRLLL